jgi:hypothetical protein
MKKQIDTKELTLSEKAEKHLKSWRVYLKNSVKF